MTISIFKSPDVQQSEGPIGNSGLNDIIKKTGQFPVMSLVIKPLQGANNVISQALNVSGQQLIRFLSYNFQSSVTIPVDSFSFSFAAPDAEPITEKIHEGDLVVLTANGVELATGIIDQIEVETDAEFGEKVTLNGRDLMSQLEDQDAISLDMAPIWVEDVSVKSGVEYLCQQTRIKTINIVGSVTAQKQLLATEPGESKLAALQRLLEPVNCVAWMAPNGTMNVGKPNMSQKATDAYFIKKAERQSNCLSMRIVRSATTIPNLIVPIWSGQETTVNRIKPDQVLQNVSAGPNRLLQLGHRLPKTVVVSTPKADSPQDLSTVNKVRNAAGDATLLQAYAKREMARKNTKAVDVQVVVPGHFSSDGKPFRVDTVYHLTHDRASLDADMYLYQIDYQLTPDGGQRTNLFFCPLGTIVADNEVPPGFASLTNNSTVTV